MRLSVFNNNCSGVFWGIGKMGLFNFKGLKLFYIRGIFKILMEVNINFFWDEISVNFGLKYFYRIRLLLWKLKIKIIKIICEN